ncbi:MAG: hypothetical protein UHG91_09760 [Succinivibrionaceae bacterium]|nr:hypothetical protein [Ruminobacter sp.]MDY5779946.1 hypothetical protein [Succinivibrionaceae bacterium]MEE1341036.1 hypothetical protein [Succinivibrionaceae bacterium]
MKKIVLLFGFLSLFLVSACTHKAVPMSYVKTTLPNSYELCDMEEVILSAALTRGFSVVSKNPQEIVLSYGRDENEENGYSASIKVKYDSNSYEFIYVDSTNLKYDASKQLIHPSYNRWIKNLDIDIKKLVTIKQAK